MIPADGPILSETLILSYSVDSEDVFREHIRGQLKWETILSGFKFGKIVVAVREEYLRRDKSMIRIVFPFQYIIGPYLLYIQSVYIY